MSNNQKIAVIGNESSILIYRAIGAETFGVVDAKNAQEVLEKLIKMPHDEDGNALKYGILFVEESHYKLLPSDFIIKLTERPLPAVVPVPAFKTDKKSFATTRLSRIVEKAIGSDILG